MKAIVTKYHGPGNVRGSRISATDNNGNRVTVPYDHALSGEACHRVAFLALCAKLGVPNLNEYVFSPDRGAGYVYVRVTKYNRVTVR